MNFISNLATKKQAWALLAISAFVFELCALFFQYGMGLAPCIMCIYQRVAIWAIFFGGVITYMAPNQLIMRLLGYGLWGTGAIWGLIIALEHVEMQSATLSLFFTCDFTPNFPSWAPLHEWLPFLFEATGDCGEISWQFLGYSMPQWMVVIYGAYTAVLAAVLASRIAAAKNL
ncbi:disulfide bond formation protein DsbB [Thalassotalea sp. M1531]|uniref:Disulfide bond formation protein B n=1 Tax=Thalassotalea algicola TaxID=2716224 RepID=A0A7Y0LFI6_9GAMM|nr:disulfide bond formation protein DsbB [Thalassotalea algicola]NMP33207.1 disulfide bond formation protein DsbB [Thalassotalea algicola]